MAENPDYTSNLEPIVLAENKGTKVLNGAANSRCQQH